VTIGAEQGLIGELPYLALVVACALALLRAARRDMARAAIAAALLALVFHTQLYADFLEDPVAWTLLGVGVALPLSRRLPDHEHAAPEGEVAVSANQLVNPRASDPAVRPTGTLPASWRSRS